MNMLNKFHCIELKVDTKNKRQCLYRILLSLNHLRVPTVCVVNILSIHYHLYPVLFDRFLLCLTESGFAAIQY